MAAGEVTSRITDVHVDYGRNRITYSITRDVELKDGTKVAISSETQEGAVLATASLQALTLASIVSVAPINLSSAVVVDAGSVVLG